MTVTTYALRQAVHAAAFGQVPVLTGATDDLVLVDGRLHGLRDGLAIELRAAYDGILLAAYDVADGLHAVDSAREAELRRAYVDLLASWPAGAARRPVGLEDGAQLCDLRPAHALAAAAALLRQAQRP